MNFWSRKSPPIWAISASCGVDHSRRAWPYASNGNMYDLRHRSILSEKGVVLVLIDFVTLVNAYDIGEDPWIAEYAIQCSLTD